MNKTLLSTVLCLGIWGCPFSSFPSPPVISEGIVDAFIQGTVTLESDGTLSFDDNGLTTDLTLNEVFRALTPVKIVLTFPTEMTSEAEDPKRGLVAQDQESNQCIMLLMPGSDEGSEIVVKDDGSVTLDLSLGWVYVWGKWPTKVNGGLVTVKAKGTSGIIESYDCGGAVPCERVYLVSFGAKYGLEVYKLDEEKTKLPIRILDSLGTYVEAVNKDMISISDIKSVDGAIRAIRDFFATVEVRATAVGIPWE